MPNTKYGQLRQRTLDRCLSDKTRRYTTKMLMDECNKDLGEGFEVTSLNTIRADLREIDADYCRVEEYKGADGRQRFYRYEDPDFSIYKMPLTDSQLAGLLQTISLMQSFENMPQYKWMQEILDKFGIAEDAISAIGFDQNLDLEGRHYFSDIFQYIMHKSPIQLSYRSFRRTEPITAIVHPYYLKEYNKRWFLLAWNEELGMLTNFALDRIVSIEPTSHAFIPMKDLCIADYYDEMIGVTRNLQDESQKVRIWVSASSYPYVRTKPLHGTQRVVETSPTGTTIEIDVILNYELEQAIFYYGENMKVLSPQSLVDKIKERTQKLAELYKQ